MKILYFDVETTGKDPKTHEIVQLAGIIEIDGIVNETFDIHMKPTDFESIDPEALEVNHTSIEELKGYPEPSQAHTEFISILGRYVDKFDKTDKFYPAGFNVRFDIDFLRSFFVRHLDLYFGSWFNYKAIDPLPILHFMEYCGSISLPDYKLETVCEHFNVKIEAHEALSDVTATRDLLHILKKGGL